MNFWRIVFIVLLITSVQTATLNDCNDNIYPMSGDIVVCTNDCNECNIYCNGIDRCKSDIRVFSGALSTNIYCEYDNSCEGSSFYLGNNMDYNIPNNYNINDFVNNYHSINIHCTGNTACKSTYFHISGSYLNGVNINVDGANNVDSLEDSTLKCDIEYNQTCTLMCGNDETRCSNLSYKCYSGNCQCIGSACSLLRRNRIIMKTPSPSMSTKTPTNTPTETTIYPTNIPSNTPNIETILQNNSSSTTTAEPMTMTTTIIGENVLPKKIGKTKLVLSMIFIGLSCCLLLIIIILAIVNRELIYRNRKSTKDDEFGITIVSKQGIIQSIKLTNNTTNSNPNINTTETATQYDSNVETLTPPKVHVIDGRQITPKTKDISNIEFGTPITDDILIHYKYIENNPDIKPNRGISDSTLTLDSILISKNDVESTPDQQNSDTPSNIKNDYL